VYCAEDLRIRGLC